MSTLKLTINEQKTRICRVPQESFNFLGYTIGRYLHRDLGLLRLALDSKPDAAGRNCLFGTGS